MWDYYRFALGSFGLLLWPVADHNSGPMPEQMIAQNSPRNGPSIVDPQRDVTGVVAISDEAQVASVYYETQNPSLAMNAIEALRPQIKRLHPEVEMVIDATSGARVAKQKLADEWMRGQDPITPVQDEGMQKMKMMNDSHPCQRCGLPLPSYDAACWNCQRREQDRERYWTRPDRKRKAAYQVLGMDLPGDSYFAQPPQFPNDPRTSGWHVSDYNGWTNWETWNTKLMMDSERELADQWNAMMQRGMTKEQLRDWAIKNVIGPHNQQAMADAQEWNDIPEEERLDPHYEDFKDEHGEDSRAMDLYEGIIGGPDTSDTQPMLIDSELVNWDEIYQHILDDIEEERRYEQGLPPSWQEQQPNADQPGDTFFPNDWTSCRNKTSMANDPMTLAQQLSTAYDREDYQAVIQLAEQLGPIAQQYAQHYKDVGEQRRSDYITYLVHMPKAEGAEDYDARHQGVPDLVSKYKDAVYGAYSDLAYYAAKIVEKVTEGKLVGFRRGMLVDYVQAKLKQATENGTLAQGIGMLAEEDSSWGETARDPDHALGMIEALFEYALLQHDAYYKVIQSSSQAVERVGSYIQLMQDRIRELQEAEQALRAKLDDVHSQTQAKFTDEWGSWGPPQVRTHPWEYVKYQPPQIDTLTFPSDWTSRTGSEGVLPWKADRELGYDTVPVLADAPESESDYFYHLGASQVMYHVTHRSRLDDIMKQGLMPNSEATGMTAAATWAKEVYGVWPIFLSTDPSMWHEMYQELVDYDPTSDWVVLTVNTSGLQLVADLPSLIDGGANVEPDEGLWWDDGQEPEALTPYLNDGFISFAELLSTAAPIAMAVTESAACLEPITPDRISVAHTSKTAAEPQVERIPFLLFEDGSFKIAPSYSSHEDLMDHLGWDIDDPDTMREAAQHQGQVNYMNDDGVIDYYITAPRIASQMSNWPEIEQQILHAALKTLEDEGYKISHVRKTATDDWNPEAAPQGPYYHGTNAELAPGAELHSAQFGGYDTYHLDKENYLSNLVYMTTEPHLAERYAVAKAGRSGGEPHVYEVRPIGQVQRDPEFTASGFGSDQVVAPMAEVVQEIPLPGLVRWENGSLKRNAKTAGNSWWHLTDNPNFQLDPAYHPINNTTLGGDWPEPGLMVAKNPEAWYNGYDYVRPFVAEIEGDAKDMQGYMGEHFIPASQFSQTNVKRVLPYSAWEAEHFDNRPYRGPDVRQMTPEQQQEHIDRTQAYIRKNRPHMLSFPCSHCGAEHESYNECQSCGELENPERDKYTHRGYLPEFMSKTAMGQAGPLPELRFVWDAEGGWEDEEGIGGCLSAYVGDEFVGHISLYPSGEIAMVEVPPQWQRRGIATALTNELDHRGIDWHHSGDLTNKAESWIRGQGGPLKRMPCDNCNDETLPREKGNPQCSYCHGEGWYTPGKTASAPVNWVYWNGHVHHGPKPHYRLIEELAKTNPDLDQDMAKQLSSRLLVNAHPSGLNADIAAGHYTTRPQIYFSTIDRNHVYDEVTNALQNSTNPSPDSPAFQGQEVNASNQALSSYLKMARNGPHLAKADDYRNSSRHLANTPLATTEAGARLKIQQWFGPLRQMQFVEHARGDDVWRVELATPDQAGSKYIRVAIDGPADMRARFVAEDDPGWMESLTGWHTDPQDEWPGDTTFPEDWHNAKTAMDWYSSQRLPSEAELLPYRNDEGECWDIAPQVAEKFGLVNSMGGYQQG